jgi:biopolymer transport protein ExbB
MYPIAALSVLALALVIYFSIVLRREQLIPSRFITGLQGMLREGKLSEARASCHVNTSAIAAVMESALDYAVRHGGKTESGLLREIVQGEGTRQATLLQNQTTYLNDIGVLAPMLGLLGTVWGMLQAFNVVALDMARAKPLDLASGISLAMITTVGGLVVAIPSMGAYFFFRNRAARLIADLEVTASRLLQEIERTQHRED